MNREEVVDDPCKKRAALAPSSSSLGLLARAPLADDWNKENLPVPEERSKTLSGGGGQQQPLRLVGIKEDDTAFASPRPYLSSSDKKGCGNDNDVSASSPANLLKRPLAPVGQHTSSSSPEVSVATPGSGFTIKRRKGLMSERSVSVEDLTDEQRRPGLLGVGASPELAEQLLTSPVARPMLLQHKKQVGRSAAFLGCKSSPSTPLRRGQGEEKHVSQTSSFFGQAWKSFAFVNGVSVNRSLFRTIKANDITISMND